jgi:hypothetical protein
VPIGVATVKVSFKVMSDLSALGLTYGDASLTVPTKKQSVGTASEAPPYE